MVSVSNSSIGSFEHMLAEVYASGTPEQQQYAEKLAQGYRNVGIGLEVSLQLHRDALAKLLVEVKGEGEKK